MTSMRSERCGLDEEDQVRSEGRKERGEEKIEGGKTRDQEHDIQRDDASETN